MRTTILFFLSACCIKAYSQEEPARVEIKYRCDIERLPITLKMERSTPNDAWVLQWDHTRMDEDNKQCQLWLNVFENGAPIAYFKSGEDEQKVNFESTADSLSLSFSLGNKYRNVDCNCFFKPVKLATEVAEYPELILEQDRQWYFYKYLGMNAFEEALVNRDKYEAQIVRLNMQLHYINLKNGKIALGERWNKKGNIYRITQKWDLAPVFPYQNYSTKSGKEISGEDLIRSKKIAIEEFEGLEKQFNLPRYHP